MKIARAMQQLNKLIDQGYYFNQAIDMVCAQFGLTDSEYFTVVNMYDSQG